MLWSREKLSLVLQLFAVFFRIGPSTFGGGYAMIPVIEKEFLRKRKWFDELEMTDMISLAGTGPGGVGVNLAAFIGYRNAGMAGAVAAVAGITLPTFLIVLSLSLGYLFLHDMPKVEAALKGIHGAVIALILMAAYRIAKQAVFDSSTAVMVIVTIVLLLSAQFSPMYMIAFGLLAGIIVIQGKKWFGLDIHTEKEKKSHSNQDPVQPEYFI
ncbi:chromate transporter [Paenibacillus sp. MDMC362]|uniref:chromate transporter n=1 Tax=Paenibacillus sp. MDMC362 TaxID=2977365 RepID=UPI000DC3642A|nr:chromate transporter [Paenibacillus sp. MDMC362]RAR44691.1 chromate transporter [Paenibacillus sp. MDMC362]